MAQIHRLADINAKCAKRRAKAPERQLRGFALSLTDFVVLPYPLVNKGYKQQVSRLIVR